MPKVMLESALSARHAVASSSRRHSDDMPKYARKCSSKNARFSMSNR
jgi:hypothetical protein